MITVVSDADVQEAVAWKDGLFYMSSADIGTVMRSYPGGMMWKSISKEAFHPAIYRENTA